MLRKVPKQKYDSLQVFCKLRKYPANYRAAFTRQRSLVRIQHRPLRKSVVLQEKPQNPVEGDTPPSALLTTVGIPTVDLVLYSTHPHVPTAAEPFPPSSRGGIWTGNIRRGFLLHLTLQMALEGCYGAHGKAQATTTFKAALRNSGAPELGASRGTRRLGRAPQRRPPEPFQGTPSARVTATAPRARPSG